LDRVLGSGATATVYEGQLIRRPEEEPDERKRTVPVAVKVIPRQGFCDRKKKILE
jgi:hypothetical protein